MTSRRFLSLQNVLLITIAIIVVAVNIRRSFLGVELTDEAFYIAEARLIMQGTVPFVTGWFQAAGATLFYFWLVPLYELINGGTDGIFIFMRIAYVAFKILCLSIVYLILKKVFNPKILFIFLLTLVPLAPNYMFMISYNSISIFLTLIGQALIIVVLLNAANNKSIIYCVSAGVIMGLATFAHVQVAFISVLFGVFLLLIPRNSTTKKETLSYFIGFMIVCIISLFALSVAGGGLGNLISGIRTIIFESTYFQIPVRSFEKSMVYLYNSLSPHIGYIIFVLSCCVFGIFCRIREKREIAYPVKIKEIVLKSLLLITIIYVVVLIIQSEALPRATYDVICALVFVPAAILPYLSSEKRKQGWIVLLLLWGAGLLSITASSIMVWSGLPGRFYLLHIGAMSTILLFSLLFDNESKKTHSAAMRGSGWVILLSVVLIISLSVQQYMYVYRDAPYNQLNFKVERGVYKNILTTEERGRAIVELEDEIRALTSTNDDVLFLDNVPMAYLMTDAFFCTPITWDIMNYYHGINDDRIMQKFFEKVGRTPNKIVYIFIGRDNQLSIEDEDYVFNRFVFDNYNLVYENPDILFRIIMFENVE